MRLRSRSSASSARSDVLLTLPSSPRPFPTRPLTNPTDTSFSGSNPRSFLIACSVSPPPNVSALTTSAFMSPTVAASGGPSSSGPHRTSTGELLGLVFSTNNFAAFARVSYGSMRSLCRLFVSKTSPVTPMYSIGDESVPVRVCVTAEAVARRSLWPACILSNVPPTEVLSMGEEEEDVSPPHSAPGSAPSSISTSSLDLRSRVMRWSSSPRLSSRVIAAVVSQPHRSSKGTTSMPGSTLATHSYTSSSTATIPASSSEPRPVRWR